MATSTSIFTGPNFSSLDLQTDAESTLGAQASVNGRRDRGGLEGIYGQSAVATDGSATILGLHDHVNPASGASTRLSFSADGYVYANGTRCIRADNGQLFQTPGTGKFIVAQDGPRSFFTSSSGGGSGTLTFPAVNYSTSTTFTKSTTIAANAHTLIITGKVTLAMNRAGSNSSANCTAVLTYAEERSGTATLATLEGGSTAFAFTGTALPAPGTYVFNNYTGTTPTMDSWSAGSATASTWSAVSGTDPTSAAANSIVWTGTLAPGSKTFYVLFSVGGVTGTFYEPDTAPGVPWTFDVSEATITGGSPTTSNAGFPCWFDSRIATPTVFVDYLPSAPTITSATPSQTGGTVLMAMTGTEGATLNGSQDPTIPSMAGWVVGGGFTGANYQQYFGLPIGTGAIHIDTTGALASGDSAKYTFTTAQNWSSVTTFSFKAASSASDNATGPLMSLEIADAAGHTDQRPIYFSTFGTDLTININFTDWATNVDKTTIKSLAFVNQNGTSPYVVHMTGFQAYSGLTTDVNYKMTTTRTDDTGDAAQPFISPASAATSVKAANTTGYAVAVVFPAIPTGHTGQLWRQDVGVTGQYHSVTGYTAIAAGTTTLTDRVTTNATNPVLKEGRTQVPTGAIAIGVHQDGRVMLGTGATVATGYKTGSVYMSNTFDVTTFPNYSLATIADAGLTFESTDGCYLSVLDAGTIVAFSSVGSWSGSVYQRQTLVHGSQATLLLTGTQPDVPDSDPNTWFRMGHRIPIGLCGVQAVTNVRDGVAIADNNGDVILIDRNLEPHLLSEDLSALLRNSALWTGSNANRTNWRLVWDNAQQWLTLFAEATVAASSRYFRLDMAPSKEWGDGIGWDEVAYNVTFGVPTAVATTGTGEAAYAMVGYANGLVKRLYDPTVVTLLVTYTTAAFGLRNVKGLAYQNRAYKIVADFSGTVTWSVYGQTGATTTTLANAVTLTTGTVFRNFNPSAFERLWVAANLSTGAFVRHFALEAVPRIV